MRASWRVDMLVNNAGSSALDVVTVGLAQAHGPQVRVNSIRPGSFTTTVSEHWSPEVARLYSERVVAGRVADPQEIVGAALFLASRGVMPPAARLWRRPQRPSNGPL